MKLFKSSMQRHTEKKDRIESEIALLKSKQKAEYENTITFYKNKKTSYRNNVAAQLDSFRTQIETLKVKIGETKEFETTQLKVFDKEMAIRLQEVDNKFNAKILRLTNDQTTLKNLIEKEEKDLKDLMAPLKTPETSKPKVLLESVSANDTPTVEKVVKKRRAKKKTKKQK